MPPQMLPPLRQSAAADTRRLPLLPCRPFDAAADSCRLYAFRFSLRHADIAAAADAAITPLVRIADIRHLIITLIAAIIQLRR